MSPCLTCQVDGVVRRGEIVAFGRVWYIMHSRVDALISLVRSGVYPSPGGGGPPGLVVLCYSRSADFFPARPKASSIALRGQR